jgi:hypothetical protein
MLSECSLPAFAKSNEAPLSGCPYSAMFATFQDSDPTQPLRAAAFRFIIKLHELPVRMRQLLDLLQHLLILILQSIKAAV